MSWAEVHEREGCHSENSGSLSGSVEIGLGEVEAIALVDLDRSEQPGEVVDLDRVERKERTHRLGTWTRGAAVSRSAFYNLITPGDASVLRIGRSVRVLVGELQALIERYAKQASPSMLDQPW